MAEQKDPIDEAVVQSEQKARRDAFASAPELTAEVKMDEILSAEAPVVSVLPDADINLPAKQAIDDSIDDSTAFDNEKTAKAIDDIVAKEGDEILAVQDAAAGKAGIKVVKRGNLFGRWWRNKWSRGFTLLLIFGGVAAAGVMPTSRYWVLNTATVRSEASVIILDETTNLPLKGVDVRFGDKQALTNGDGVARVSGLKLGPQSFSVEQVGFASVDRTIIIGWGSNPQGSIALKAVGVQYVIDVRDYLSDLPIEGVEALGSDAAAVSDRQGKITLTMSSAVTAGEGISLQKNGYRTESITLPSDPKETIPVLMVATRKTVFITKQTGKYDIYKSDIDGKNRQVLLPGTGNENSNISLVVSPDGARAALVSTRDNKRDADGSLLSSLALINVENGDMVTIAQSSQIQLIDWVGSRLVFQQVGSASSADNRYIVASYNYADNTRLQLVAANKLEAVLAVQGVVYYAVGADLDNATKPVGLFKISADGTGKQRLFEEEVITVLRTTYDTLSLQAADSMWHSLAVATGTITSITTPTNLASRQYIDNSDRSKSVWIGQGVLHVYDVASKKDTEITGLSGLTYPMQWLTNSAVIYRISNGAETADYTRDVQGNSSRKLADVAGTYGFAHAQ